MEKGELVFEMVTIILPRLSVKNKFRDTGFIHLPFPNFGKLEGFPKFWMMNRKLSNFPKVGIGR